MTKFQARFLCNKMKIINFEIIQAIRFIKKIKTSYVSTWTGTV